MRERSGLAETVEAIRKYKRLVSDLEGARSLSREEADPELREMAKEELRALEAAKDGLEEAIKLLLVPRDPLDDKNIIVEIRAGTGGDEAALFAADLFRMYTRYAEAPRLEDRGDERERDRARRLQGDHLLRSGERGLRRHALGVRRAPRPARPGDRGQRPHPHLRRDRGGAARGGGDRDRDRRERPAHRRRCAPAAPAASASTPRTRRCASPTCRPGSSSTARTRRARSRTRPRPCASSAPGSSSSRRRSGRRARRPDRKSQIGSGDRSERIRTYNFPQNRVTDHRVELTLYKLDLVMEGELDEFVEALKLHAREDALKAERT